jgi:hypothetical protein
MNTDKTTSDTDSIAEVSKARLYHTKKIFHKGKSVQEWLNEENNES